MNAEEYAARIKCYDKCVQEHLRKLDYEGSSLSHLLQRALNLVSAGPPREVRPFRDFLDAKAQPLRKTLLKKEKTADQQNSDELSDELEKLAIVEACIEAARRAVSPSDAWRLLNKASSVLIQLPGEVFDKRDFLTRYHALEPALDKHLAQIYGEYEAQKLKGERTVATEIYANDGKGSTLVTLLSIYSHQWSVVSQAVRFKRRLTRGVTVSLALVTLLAFISIFLLHEDHQTPNSGSGSPIDLFWIFAFSLLGGATSALLESRDHNPTATDFRNYLVKFWMRTLVGAIGGFVVYTILTVPGIASVGIVSAVTTQLSVFAAVGFVGGFSELFFRSMVDRFIGIVASPGKKVPLGEDDLDARNSASSRQYLSAVTGVKPLTFMPNFPALDSAAGGSLPEFPDTRDLCLYEILDTYGRVRPDAWDKPKDIMDTSNQDVWARRLRAAAREIQSHNTAYDQDLSDNIRSGTNSEASETHGMMISQVADWLARRAHKMSSPSN
ncbi:hypothetical protein IQ260_22065 [Leptolyngbya cf. ectocarpi LEGE 11479]|uniref:Uncharacterized protein n=1 Tax=Leptolyngbya cf. ectocarpi LEGE 11479 TaxID=1828722 RepID=A0A928ZXS1_LEPEC|nr:hypothetical protein [Leptolyngbya ectocarpi]MBE9069333.1 hypothetical protein [Leptolyngbya cf. ectocarpi LEGE 11479]